MDEISKVQQEALTVWVQRQFALPVGRGMFNYASLNIVSTEIFPIPELVKTARMPPTNSLVQLDIPLDCRILDWPEYHMGVASALQITPDCKDVTGSWIMFNQSKTESKNNAIDSSHAGFIFGLGLSGHLKKFQSKDSLRGFLNPHQELVCVGHLLGLCASFIGTRDAQITKLITVHLPNFEPDQSV